MIGGGSGGAGHVIHHPPRSFLSSTSARGVGGLPPSGSRSLVSHAGAAAAAGAAGSDRSSGHSSVGAHHSSTGSLATPFALQQSAAKVTQLHGKAYQFLHAVLHRYRELKQRLLSVESNVDQQREALNRDAGVAEELKRELEVSLEVVAFITNIACKDAAQQAQQGVTATSPSTPLVSSPSSAYSSPRSGNSSTSGGGGDRDRDRNHQQTNGGGGGGGLLRFPRPSGPTDRFVVLASRLVQQRRRDRASTMQSSSQPRRVSVSSAQPPASVAAIAAATAASPAPPAAPASFGLGFSNSSLLGLTVHCNSADRSGLTTSAPQLSNQSPNVHSRAVSNQEPLSHTQPSQQFAGNPTLSQHGSSSGGSNPSGNLSHGYSSHQNLKSLLTKQHQQLVNGPKLGGGGNSAGGGGSNSGGSSGNSSGGASTSKQLQQQLGLVPQHSSHRPIPGGSSEQHSGTAVSSSVQHTPVASRNTFLTQPAGATAGAKPATPAFVPFAPAELPSLLAALGSDDLLLLHRRYTEDIHASIWSLLVSARQRSRAALANVEQLVQEREEIARASADCVDLAYHYKQCLDATAASIAPTSAAMTHAARSSSAGAAGAAAASTTGEFDPAPTLGLYHELFPHALQPHRNWSELLSSRHASASAASSSAAAARSDVQSGVSLLSELIEWHRRLMDAARIIEAQIAAAASASGGAPGGPATTTASASKSPGHAVSAPFPIAVRPNAAELRKPDTSAVFVN